MMKSTVNTRIGRRTRGMLGLLVLGGALVTGAAHVQAAPSSTAQAAPITAAAPRDQRASTFGTNMRAITTAALNQRSGPGTSYRVQQVIPADTSVFITAGPTNGNWYTVSYNNQVGYVSGAYLLQGPSEPYTNGTTTATLNLRTGPGTGYRVQQVIPAGATVFVNQGPTSGWYNGNYTGVGGYVASAYVRIP